MTLFQNLAEERNGTKGMESVLQGSAWSGEELVVERDRGRVPLLALEEEEPGVNEATDEEVELVEAIVRITVSSHLDKEDAKIRTEGGRGRTTPSRRRPRSPRR